MTTNIPVDKETVLKMKEAIGLIGALHLGWKKAAKHRVREAQSVDDLKAVLLDLIDKAN